MLLKKKWEMGLELSGVFISIDQSHEIITSFHFAWLLTSSQQILS